MMENNKRKNNDFKIIRHSNQVSTTKQDESVCDLWDRLERKYGDNQKNNNTTSDEKVD